MVRNARRVRPGTGCAVVVIAAVAFAASARAEADSAVNGGAKPAPKGYITFAINTHDFVHVKESADILLRLIGLFEKHGVRGDFYLTAPVTRHYAETRPDVIGKLRRSGMTISYHMRPPHILYGGFNDRLLRLGDAELLKTLRDYETFRLDMTTGDLLRDQPGGYAYVAKTFGRKPVALGLPVGNPRLRRAARRVYGELGARVVVEHHESGTKPDRPFEWIDELLIRPSDFSVTRWSLPGGPRQDAFWWNMLSTPKAAEYDPTTYLKKRLAQWRSPRPPMITCLIHENNFYRCRSTPWALIYYTDSRKGRPLKPPYNLKAPDASRPRPQRDRQAVWKAYEQIVAYAAANLKVVTSQDIVKMAESARKPNASQGCPTPPPFEDLLLAQFCSSGKSADRVPDVPSGSVAGWKRSFQAGSPDASRRAHGDHPSDTAQGPTLCGERLLDGDDSQGTDPLGSGAGSRFPGRQLEG